MMLKWMYRLHYYRRALKLRIDSVTGRHDHGLVHPWVGSAGLDWVGLVLGRTYL